MKREQRPLLNGGILAIVAVALSTLFSVKGQWNGGTIAVIVIIALLTAFQFWLYFSFFKKK